jgi:DNA-binding MarR family transcriptional regulator
MSTPRSRPSGQAEAPGHAGAPGQAEEPGQAEGPGQAGAPGQEDVPGHAGAPGQAEAPSQAEPSGQAEAPGRAELIGMITDEVREQQIAYDRFHDAVAAYLGLNRTDLRCLDILDLAGRRTAGELAARMGMSTGAVTAMLDRLERAGYVQRLRDLGDRRRVLVEPTELAGERGQEIYAPFGEQVEPMFARFTDAQLALVRDFLRLGNDFYVGQTSRIEQLARRTWR